MAVSQAIPITRHPYADGSYKKMLIDGQWVDAASGKKFETLNPATGELLVGDPDAVASAGLGGLEGDVVGGGSGGEVVEVAGK